MNINRLRRIAKEIATENIHKLYNHVSIITDSKGREVLAIGTNGDKTHVLQRRFKYPYDTLHSEVHALSKLSDNISIEQCVLFNFRFNNTLNLAMAKPCKYCLPWCLRFKNIYYSNKLGKVIRYET